MRRSEALFYRKAHEAAVSEATIKIDAIRSTLDAALEGMAVQTFGAPDAAKETLFSPPEKPVKVHCWHCGSRYMSSSMTLEYRPRFQAAAVDTLGEGYDRIEPLWWCRDADCDGAGFGHDIHAVQSRARRTPGATDAR